MTELSDLLEKSKIKFPRAINLGEAKALMNFMAESMRAHVGCSYNTRVEIERSPNALQRTKETHAEFEGSITKGKSSIFRLVEYPVGKYSGLKFDTTTLDGGSNPEKREVQLWEETRTVIERYFSQREIGGDIGGGGAGSGHSMEY